MVDLVEHLMNMAGEVEAVRRGTTLGPGPSDDVVEVVSAIVDVTCVPWP